MLEKTGETIFEFCEFLKYAIKPAGKKLGCCICFFLYRNKNFHFFENTTPLPRPFETIFDPPCLLVKMGN